MSHNHGLFTARPPADGRPRASALRGGPDLGPGAPPPDALDALERFAREVSNCGGAAEQLRFALQTVRAGTGANAVCCCPGAAGGAVELLADRALPADWCMEFARRQLAETPGVEGRLLRAELAPPANRLQPGPRSVAMVRLSKTRDSWLAALTFAPNRALQVADLKFLALVRQILVGQYRRDRLHGGLADTLHWLVQCLTATIEARMSPGALWAGSTRGHCERVAQIAVQIGRRMHLPRPVLSDLYFAGLLHDIGLTGVSEAVLRKAGPLTPEELDEVRRSPLVGDRMLAEIRQLAHLRPAVRGHREWYDGTGYPDGLAGESIPLMARILAVAEGFDALVTPRPPRPGLSPAEGAAALTEGAGRQWDPHIVGYLLASLPALEPLWKSASLVPGVRQAVEVWSLDTSHELARPGSPDLGPLGL